MTEAESRKTHRARWGVAVLIVVAIVVAAGIYLMPNKPATGMTEVTVAQWGQERYLIYLPLYVAMDKGYFEEEGLKVDIKFTGNDDQTFAAVVSGDAQFGVGDPVFAAISQERGYPAKVIATIVGGVAIWGVTNNDEIPVIEERQQLAGLRVGTFPSPSTNYTLMKELISTLPSGVSQPTIVQAPIGSQLALLESGSADIAMVLEPGASLAEHEGYRVVYSSPHFHGNFAFTGVTTTADYLSENPSVAQRFVNALEKAMVAAHRDPAIAVEVGLKLFPNLDKAVVERAVRRMIDERTFPEHAVVDADAWQNALKTRLAVGDLAKPQPTEQTVDSSFAIKAKASHGID